MVADAEMLDGCFHQQTVRTGLQTPGLDCPRALILILVIVILTQFSQFNTRGGNIL